MKKHDEDFEAFEEWEGEEEGEEMPEEDGFDEEPVEEEIAEEPEMDVEPEQEKKASEPKTEAKPPVPPKFDRAALDLSPDVPVQVIAVIGKRGITIKELMELRMGQVIDLKRPPNETVDVVVNGKLFARGELVEIDGKLGVKIIKLAR